MSQRILCAMVGGLIALSPAWGAEPAVPQADIPLPANAGITMDYYRNFFSGSMNHLMQLVADRTPPSGSVVLNQFEARDWTTQTRTTDLSRLYALYLHGYLIPTEDGLYRLSAVSRGELRVFLSPDANEAHAVPLAFVATDVTDTSVAEPVSLRVGQRYFVSAMFLPGWKEQLGIRWVKLVDGVEVGEPVLISAAHLRTSNQ